MSREEGLMSGSFRDEGGVFYNFFHGGVVGAFICRHCKITIYFEIINMPFKKNDTIARLIYFY